MTPLRHPHPPARSRSRARSLSDRAHGGGWMSPDVRTWTLTPGGFAGQVVVTTGSLLCLDHEMVVETARYTEDDQDCHRPGECLELPVTAGLFL
jgi:hypothetical protein